MIPFSGEVLPDTEIFNSKGTTAPSPMLFGMSDSTESLGSPNTASLSGSAARPVPPCATVLGGVNADGGTLS